MKKKKTLHLRRIRKRSENKSNRFIFSQFPQLFNNHFYMHYENKKKLLYSFMLSFYCIGHDKIQNFLKKFGMLCNFKIGIQRKGKDFSLRLKNKFYKENNPVYKFRRRKTAIIKIFFLKKFKYFYYNPIKKRLKHVNLKKKLRLHFSYRHLLRLPVRGQRTKTNAKTRKNYHII